MSLQTNISFTDAKPTPETHIYSARGTNNGLATWMDVSDGVNIGMPTITLSHKSSDGSNGAYRVEGRITIPVLEVAVGTVGGYEPIPKVAYKMFAKFELVAPNRSSLQDRKDLRKILGDLVFTGVTAETIEDFNPAN